MVLISVAFWLMCLDSDIDRIDGIILISMLSGFLVYGLATAKDKNGTTSTAAVSVSVLTKNALFIILGIVMLAFGANFVVREAIQIASRIGLSQTFIGISVVALGTSLPELATSAVAAAKGESDISVGNVVGSNLFNICLVMGVVGLFNPMVVDSGLHLFQFPFMIFICIVLWATAFRFGRIGKLSGIILILLFIIYIIVSYMN